MTRLKLPFKTRPIGGRLRPRRRALAGSLAGVLAVAVAVPAIVLAIGRPSDDARVTAATPAAAPGCDTSKLDPDPVHVANRAAELSSTNPDPDPVHAAQAAATARAAAACLAATGKAPDGWGGSLSSTPKPRATPGPATPTPTPTRDATQAQPTPSNAAPTAKPSPAAGSPTGVARSGLFVDPTSAAARQLVALRAKRSPEAAAIARIAAQPQAQWIGDWSGDPGTAVAPTLAAAAKQHARALFAVYAIPDRDCGSYSAGGVTAQRYEAFIGNLAKAIGPHPATIVLEPDAVAQADCLSGPARTQRFALLRTAIRTLAALPNTNVYLDAGHAGWKSPDDIAAGLRAAGIAGATGFALNTSNFDTTDNEVRYGRQVAAKVGGKPFVIDTSRNGNGPKGNEWCNPTGRALGHPPTTRTGIPGVDALLWIKRPGESDGPCNGGPPAGQWWEAGAVALATGGK